MITAKVFKKVREFEGEPKLEDFELVTETLGELQDGDFLIEAEFLSVDPYMRVFDVEVGSVVIGGQIGRIIESKNSRFPVGSYVFAHVGWRTHTIVNPDNKYIQPPYILPDFGDLPRSLGLGACGMPGNTAYFGFLDICRPQAGEVLVVSGAAGAVGSLVGQIGKLKGMTVIGLTGTGGKCSWLRSLGFDGTINYKTQNVDDELKKLAPNGVDCYFDNVGGELATKVIFQMSDFGRISVCGAISGYNQNQIPMVPMLQRKFVFSQLSMEGFMVFRWQNQWMDGIHQMLEWVREGKIKTQETVTQGFENMPAAFIEMLKGGNTGKAIIKV